MREHRQLLKLWRHGDASALITLVRAEGSSYRRPGARMLLSKLHGVAGTISGGCLEADIARRAPWLVQGGACVKKILTQFDDTSEIPFGLGCGGTLDLLMEPVNTRECDALMGAMERSLHGAPHVILTWLPGPRRALRRAVLDAHDTVVFASGGLGKEELWQARVIAASSPDGQPEGLFVERLEPPQRLIVIGAGDDARPLVSMAALLGWDVLVVDGRAHLATAERFPDASRVLIAASGLSVTEVLKPDDAAVVMTHSFEQDREMLAACIVGRPSYLGLLGARHRSSLLLSAVAAAAGLSLAECCAAVHAPIGLDLGGDGPEAIALAIIAEVQAFRMGKPSGSLRLAPHDVDRYVRDGAPAGLVLSQCAMDVA